MKGGILDEGGVSTELSNGFVLKGGFAWSQALGRTGNLDPAGFGVKITPGGVVFKRTGFVQKITLQGMAEVNRL